MILGVLGGVTRLVDLVLISGKFGFVVSELVVGSGEQDDTV